ncbi:hypothetical protein DSM100688_0384 [Bifidobacterium ramosum]|uniref:Uncharacterized protein n=1 Tax=Bifidobacterium ramosum TaxID=1798158 RepID=A0A6L4X3C7_9BIFI|nr:hypothetical protein [Bifidobacterium ramosum]KAB8289304.1 hypothetical protein DSM100688_0384 [Bifidobacterium ramosum]NEG71009.1 hypothetical protein [Bifidobacterium ramosum]
MATTDLGTTAFGVAQNAAGEGTTARVLRKIIEREWQSTGILSGGTVTGRTDMRYAVAEGAAVCQRNGQDGMSVAWWDAALTPEVGVGDGTNPRIDAIWVMAHSDSDTDNHVVLGVTQGTPSSSPVVPALPEGATAVGYMRLPAGARNTQSATAAGDLRYALVHGASMGVQFRWAENIDGTVSNTNRGSFAKQSWFFPTDRNVELKVFMCISTPEKGKNQSGVATCRFLIDGKLYTSRKIEYTENWVTYEFGTEATVSAGWHTYELVMFKQAGTDYVAHYGVQSNHDMGDDKYVGRVFRLRDMGAAK